MNSCTINYKCECFKGSLEPAKGNLQSLLLSQYFYSYGHRFMGLLNVNYECWKRNNKKKDFKSMLQFEIINLFIETH